LIIRDGNITSPTSTNISFNPGSGGNLLMGVGTITSTGNANITIQPAGTGNLSTFNQRLNSFQETVSTGNVTGTITPDFTNGTIQNLTLTGNITMNSLGNVQTGRSMALILNQDATGNRLLTSTWKFAGNARTLSTAGNATDLIVVFYDGSTYYASLTTGYA